MKYHHIIDERVGIDMAKSLIPKKVQQWLQKKLHQKAYDGILKLQKQMIGQGIKPHLALIKAASTFGIDPHEIQDKFEK